jgi:hypothetical protein
MAKRNVVAMPDRRPTPPAQSVGIARGGLTNGFDTINLLTATMTDVLEEAITTSQANVVVGAVRAVLKVVELQMKYGKPRANDPRDRDLILVQPKPKE